MQTRQTRMSKSLAIFFIVLVESSIVRGQDGNGGSESAIAKILKGDLSGMGDNFGSGLIANSLKSIAESIFPVVSTMFKTGEMPIEIVGSPLAGSLNWAIEVYKLFRDLFNLGTTNLSNMLATMMSNLFMGVFGGEGTPFDASTVRDMIDKALMRIAAFALKTSYDIMSRIWSFVRAELLPRLDKFIVSAIDSDAVPEGLKTYLREFHSLYSMLNMFGIL